MVEAHRFFSEQAREWLNEAGSQETQTRAAAIETVVRELLQMVVIDLTVDENAQEIFENFERPRRAAYRCGPDQELYFSAAARSWHQC